MMNSVNLIGRLAQAPELVYTQTGTEILPFTLAINRRPAKDGSSQTDWVECVAFGVTAGNMANYLQKGSQIAVEGRIQTRKYETRDGQQRKAVEVVAQTVHFLGKKSGNQPDDPKGQEAADWSGLGKELASDDFPFE